MYTVGDIKRKSQRRSRQRAIALIAILGVAAVCYFLVFTTDSSLHETPGTITAVETVKDSLFDTVHMPENEVVVEKDSPIITALDDNVLKQEADDRSLTSAKNINASQSQEADKAQQKPPALVYKVLSIAHFYNLPDEDTKRKSFINHWNNSYASIKPLAEKNGFIYTVFVNQEGQTTKGWLRKKDLKKVYENNKE